MYPTNGNIINTNGILDHISVIVGFVAALYLIIYDYSSPSSLSSQGELFAQQRGTISIDRANALPLTTVEGNQVKVSLNYHIADESLLGQRINAIMGIYDRHNGSLIKLSSFPNGFIINNTEGTTQLATTLTDTGIHNITAIVTLTNAEKSEKYSNDIRADLNLKNILPTALPVLQDSLLPSPSEERTEGNQEEISSDDDVDSVEE